MKKLFSALTVSMFALLLFAGVASAHVVVYPKEATQGSYEKFTVRVPTELAVPTIKVQIDIPNEITVSRFLPVMGWKYELTKDATDKIISVIWTATGDGLSSTEFGEFNMQGKISDKAASLVWKAHQTYKDGTLVDWVGAPTDDKPASITTVKAKAAPVDMKELSTTDSNMDKTADVSLYISVVALILGLLAVILAFRKRVN
ncbi:DUF1775 domain-containing protein [Paenibacillus psychroresistens]|uniref:DUF1775 domain-containing protein n=1 Tax=Paenibacillus psychroresistens TaxID=1778678 RepID=A0A6B8RKQ3_9BACL|nr:YcnI family protein [Paenibacillus psychroresistens]QGQ95938.1 DUF1775 domain-containing protein [Paenibacillus psychroresistens]